MIRFQVSGFRLTAFTSKIALTPTLPLEGEGGEHQRAGGGGIGLALLALSYILTAAGQTAYAAPDAYFYTITSQEAGKAVAEALVKEGAGDRIQATVLGKVGPLYANNKPISLEVKTLRFDEIAGTWTGNMLFITGQEVQTAMPLSGRYTQLVELPVLRERLKHGEVIGKEDLQLIEVSEAKVHKDTLLREEDFIGKTARRSIAQNRPVRQDELVNPPVVKKGEKVEVHYRTSRMDIKTSGEALEEGAVGDTIRIRNEDSKIVISGRVESDRSISVLPRGMVLAQGKEMNHAAQ